MVAYGGTERVVWWLAKGLAELGHDVAVECREGSRFPFARAVQNARPETFEAVHYFNTPAAEPTFPYVVTIGGNGRVGETFLRNTIFVSRNHAERHGATHFVHNGIDPTESQFRARKDNYLVFLAKASWKVKNVSGAIRMAAKSRHTLRIVGGSRRWANPWGAARWEGMLGGEKKRGIVAGAKGLLFPVLWHEPFGIAVIEALASGTPVLASPFGSLPELVTSDVGKICASEDEFVQAVASLSHFDPTACRLRAETHFHYRGMAEKYLAHYKTVAGGAFLHVGRVSGASRAPEHGCELGAHSG